ncbi:hypothetical protein BpHYR1_051805 [Brachionus plicatilis]|uniref:Reverse transcriptase domain-containing protein n=1 Tax=Brachionus plicatilis TaxID=10195 RepID=A0A3M7P987_BRAPC|nr:hypothetical protein BpHYR1_051805 [Brachionus plicatilis]
MWRDGLFYKLIGKVAKPIWRILYNYYNLSKIVVKYDGQLSEILDCTEKIGALLNGLNLSIIAYCDDIIILSPFYGHTMRLLEDCFKFEKEWKMEFNPRKSASLTMTKSGVNCQEKFVIYNVQLFNVDAVL